MRKQNRPYSGSPLREERDPALTRKHAVGCGPASSLALWDAPASGPPTRTTVRPRVLSEDAGLIESLLFTRRATFSPHAQNGRAGVKFLSYVAIIALVAVAAAVLGWQRQTAKDLRSEIARQRAQGKERARLSAEHQRLVAAQTTAEELERLLADRTAVAQLRKEIEAMQRRVEAVARAAPVRSAAVAEPAQAAPSIKEASIAFHLWRNAGQATSDAAFETALWAAAGGEIEALADVLALDSDARGAAVAMFARLPDAMRKELATPERLIALLTAKDVPLGSAQIVGQFPTPVDTKVAAQLIDAEGKWKPALFSMRVDGEKWRLVVPVTVVERYAAWLHAPVAAAGGSGQ